jgi:hypothetical protein
MADISEDLLKRLNIDGTLTAKEFASMLLFSGDPSSIDDIKETFRKNFLVKFKKTLDKITPDDIKRIFDPLNLSGLLKDPDSLRNEFKEYKDDLRKFLRKAKAELEEEKNRSNAKKSKADDDDDSSPVSGKAIRAPRKLKEAENFVDEKVNTIEFGDNTKRFLTDIFKRSSTAESATMKELGETLGKKLEESGGSDGGGFLSNLLLSGLLMTFWTSHIRPWLEEKFDFMEKLKGTFNALEVFVYRTLPEMIWNSISGISKILGSVAETAIKSIRNLFGKAATEVVAEGAAKAAPSTGKALAEGAVEGTTKAATEAGIEAGGKAAEAAGGKGFLKSIASGLGKWGVKVASALKFFPIIGGVLSLGFAAQRFKEGDSVGGWIDIIGAFGNFLELTPAAPVGLALSWGSIALNALLDMTTEGATPQEKSKNKLNAIKNFTGKISKWISDLPWVKSIITAGSGIGEFFEGLMSGSGEQMISGLKTLNNSFLSMISEPLLAIFESNSDDPKQGNNKKFDFAAIRRQATVKFLKSILPSSIYNMIAPLLGIGEVEKPDTSSFTNMGDSSNEKTKNKMEMYRLESQLKENTKDNEEREYRKNRLKELKENLTMLDEWDNQYMDKDIRHSIPKKNVYQGVHHSNSTVPLYDGEVSYTPKLSIGNNVIATFDPNDSFKIIAAKQGGEFEKMGKMLVDQFQSVNNQLIKTLTDGMSNLGNSNVNISNSNNASQSNPFTLNTDMILRSRTLYMNSQRVLS